MQRVLSFLAASSIFAAVTTFEEGTGAVVIGSLDNVLSFLLSGSLFIAIVAMMALFVSYQLYGVQTDIRLLLAVFFTTFSTYSINKITDKEEDAINLPDRTRFVTQHTQKIKAAAFGTCFAAIILASSRGFYALLAVMLPIVIGVLYSVGISGFRLKNVKVLKTVVVTTTWALTATIVPMVVLQRGIFEILLVFWFFFVKIFVNAILFDMRDIEGDTAKGVVTIPALLGGSKTRSVLLCLNSSLVFWLLCSYLYGFFLQYLPLLVVFIAYGYWYTLFFCKRLNVEKFMDLAVDGEWLLMGAALIPLVLR